jgi:hypothetical protein
MKIKPLTFLLSLTFLFLFCGSIFGQETEVKKEYWDNGKLKSETHYKNGELKGPITWWYETGKKEREGHFKNGKTNIPKPWYYLIKLDLNVTTTETPMKDMIQLLI